MVEVQDGEKEVGREELEKGDRRIIVFCSKMNVEMKRILSLELINRELGSDVMIEFLHQYSLGHGDYTKEREKIFEGETVESLFKKVLDFQKSE